MFMTESVQDSRTVARLNNLNHPQPDFQLVKLFAVAGVFLPLVLLFLGNSMYDLCASGPLGWFRILVWPTSVLVVGTQCSYFTLTGFYSALLNIPFYLVLGCLVWLGLQPPRSNVYLTFVGIMYLTIVGAAKFWEWLLT